MDRAARPEPFGRLLRRWRTHRGLSQLALALDAEVSARHLSWLEGGKAQPSRAMVLRLAERLDLPLRERNGLLLAAGFAPLFGERSLDDPALVPARQALERLLAAHEPAPALAVDRHWNLVAANRLVPLLLGGLPADLLGPPLNVLRVSLHPRGLAPMVRHLPAWKAHVLQRLERQVQASGDVALAALRDEIAAYPAPPARADGAGDTPDGAAFDREAVAVPLVLDTPHGTLAFITTITVFGAPHDVLLSELAIETLLPADAATADTLRALLAAAPAG